MKKFVYYIICIVSGFIILFAMSGLLVAIGGEGGPSYLFLIIVFAMITGFCKLIKRPFNRFWDKHISKQKTGK